MCAKEKFKFPLYRNKLGKKITQLHQLPELQPDPAAHPAKSLQRWGPRSGSSLAPEAPTAAPVPAGAPASFLATPDAADRGGQRVPERRRVGWS